ncbi:MAG: ABC transporter permease [Candidatus Dormibacteraeota bacterium]|nr:ABC transporter permease [Candidatus Dormibacteraeota bacterium]
MSLTLTGKVLKLQAPTILSYAGGAAFYSFLIVVLFQRFIVQHRGFINQYLTVIPRALLHAFNIGGSDLTSFGGFVGTGYLSFVWVLIIAAFTIAFTSGALARELEQGTLELILAYPLGRIQFLLSKVLALLLACGVIVAGTVAGIWLGALSQDLRISSASFLAVGAVAMAFALAIAGYGFLFSALASERSKAAVAAAGLTLAFYAVNFAAQSTEALRGLARFSLFNYYAPQNALNLGRVDVAAIALLLIVAIAGTLVAAAVFRLRDLSR